MKKVIIATLTLTPALAFAQQLGNLETLVRSIGRLVDLALPIVVGLALLAFFWGLVQFIFSQGDETKKTDAKKVMLWGVIALFVMIAVWGLVKFIGTSLGIDLNTTITVPNVPGLRQ
ncbi:MAG: pilin [bacterium]|nr:pilin [bacterium]